MSRSRMVADQRIAELEAQLAERDAEIAFLKQQLASRPQADPDTHNMVREIDDGHRFAMPNAKQFTTLLNIVTTAHRCLRPKDGNEQAFREHTYSAFAYLATVSRLPDGALSKYTRGSWLDRCDRWCGSRGLSRDIDVWSFAAALLMHGDIPHTLCDARFPLDFTFGLIEGGGKLTDGSGWKGLLAGRPLMPAIEPEQRQRWDPTARGVTISGGNDVVGQGPRGALTW